MTDKRISDFPAATQWHPDAFIPQDNPAGLTEKVTPAQVEAKLEADGFIKAASPSLGQVAVYTAGGWAPIKLADANIDAAAAIGWGKISKTGAVASDVGALPVANPTATGLFTAPAIRNTGGTTNALVKWDSDGDEVASGISDDGDDVKALSRVMYARLFRSAWAASDAPVGGSSLGVVDAETAWTKGWMLQLGAANTLDFWNSVSSTWTRRAQILPDGSIVSNALAGTGTRAVAADSTGKLVDASTGLSGSGTMAAMINGSGQIERSTNLKDNGPGGMEFIRPPIMPAPINNAPNLRLAPGSDPTTLTDGDLWFDGASLKIRIGGVTRTVTVT